MRASDAKKPVTSVARQRRSEIAPQRRAPDLSFSARALSITSAELFGRSDETTRAFLAHVFAFPEVVAVAIDKARARADVRLRQDVIAADVWRRLSAALKGELKRKAQSARSSNPHVARLSLEHPAPGAPVRIHRFDDTVSTWRATQPAENLLRLSHPSLRESRDISYRARAELGMLHGVEHVRSNALTSSVIIRFNPKLIDARRLVIAAEKAWPQLLDGVIAPPSPKKLALAGGLLTLAATAQFFRPALRPFAVLGVVLYGLPNVIRAARQLGHGEIGLPALYSAGLGFLLWSGAPFSSAVMAVFMQSWPRLSQRLTQHVDRRLFGNSRRRFVWARLKHSAGADIQIDIDKLSKGDIIVLHAGEYIPVDGVVTEGFGAVDEDMLTGVIGAIDKSPGDAVYASTFLRAGSLFIEVSRDAGISAATAIAAKLPYGAIQRLPCSGEAERVANRNAKPALALAAFSLLTTRTPRLSQAILRPDYATAPRFSAQLSTLTGLAEGLRQGILIQRPSALDRLLESSVYIFDDSAGLELGRVRVASVAVEDRGHADDVLTLATAAFAKRGDARAAAMRAESAGKKIRLPRLIHRRRVAGAIRFDDATGRLIEVATTAYVERAGLKVPDALADSLASASIEIDPSREPRETDVRPIWVARDGVVIGAVAFERGAPVAISVIDALRARNRKARFLYLSSAPQAAAAQLASRLGVEAIIGDLNPEAKARTIRDITRRAIWIGDGAAAHSVPSIQASAVSVSTGGAPTLLDDPADIVLLQSQLDGLITVKQLAQAHLARLRADYRIIYLANLFGAVGGVVAGFGSLQAGLSSNAGAGVVLASRWADLKTLARASEQRDIARQAAPTEELEIDPPSTLRPDNRLDIVVDFPDHVETSTDNDGV